MNRCQPKIPEIISRVPAGKSADSREQHFVARFRLHERNAVFSVCAIYALPGRPFLTRVSSGVKVRGGGKGVENGRENVVKFHVPAACFFAPAMIEMRATWPGFLRPEFTFKCTTECSRMKYSARWAGSQAWGKGEWYAV